MVHECGFAVTVMSHDSTPDERFDETRVGLDHFAFRVSDRAELDEWIRHFDKEGVTHSGVIEAHFGDTVVFRDPDGTQLELFVHPAPQQLDKLLESDPNAAG
jgi:catechol-2,3-dioxygenase